jgi:hypothetical protein
VATGRGRSYVAAAGNLGGSMILGIVALVAGLAIGRLA